MVGTVSVTAIALTPRTSVLGVVYVWTCRGRAVGGALAASLIKGSYYMGRRTAH